MLSKLAYDIFGAAAMSTECERLFSKAGTVEVSSYKDYKQLIRHLSLGYTLSPRRNRMKQDILEAMECQKSWEKSGLMPFFEVGELEKVLDGVEMRNMEKSLA